MPFVILLSIVGWQMLINIGDYPPYLLPSPSRIWAKLLVVWEDNTLWYHTSYTMYEAFWGFSLAFVFAMVVGNFLAHSPLLEDLVSPYFVIAQATPMLAIAPLLIVWFGFGPASKIIIAFVLVVFPMLISAIVGFRSVSANHRELMRSYSANRSQIFFLLEIPAAMPVLLGGIKIGLVHAMSGALVGEYISAGRGLGYWIILGKAMHDASLVFTALGVMIVINVALYGLMTVIEHKVLAWRKV
ncbi:MAG: ABC transporter permease [Chloroflexi bacterium]|nr:ABC transporter permease [Chloroflexota bacterium]